MSVILGKTKIYGWLCCSQNRPQWRIVFQAIAGQQWNFIRTGIRLQARGDQGLFFFFFCTPRSPTRYIEGNSSGEIIKTHCAGLAHYCGKGWRYFSLFLRSRTPRDGFIVWFPLCCLACSHATPFLLSIHLLPPTSPLVYFQKLHTPNYSERPTFWFIAH